MKKWGTSLRLAYAPASIHRPEEHMSSDWGVGFDKPSQPDATRPERSTHQEVWCRAW